MSEITSAKPVICDRCGEAIDFRIFPAAIHVVGEKNYHIGCVARVQDPRDAEIASLRAQLDEARRKAIEECIGVVIEMREGFLSPEYATGQPLSSMNERIACTMIFNNLTALLSESKT